MNMNLLHWFRLCMDDRINLLTAIKNNPYARGFLVKIKLFLIIYARDKNIPVARYQYTLGIYHRIYPADGVRNIPAAPDIYGTWRLRVKLFYSTSAHLIIRNAFQGGTVDERMISLDTFYYRLVSIPTGVSFALSPPTSCLSIIR